jgi:hypothetical protein
VLRRPIIVTTDVRSTIFNLSVPLPDTFHSHYARNTHLCRLAVNFDGGKRVYPLDVYHTTDVFVGPSSQRCCHCTWTYRVNSNAQTDSCAICCKKLLPPTEKVVSFRSPYLFYLPTAGVEVVYFHFITLRHTPQSAWLLWTRDRPVRQKNKMPN